MKIHEEVTVLLSDEYIRLVVISDQLIEHPRAYVELSAQLLCSEYRIESQYPQNTIIFELNLSIFAKALASGKFSTHSIFKLTKKDDKPYFTMECKAAESLLSMDLVHDLPIELIRVYDVSLYVPPTVSKPQVAFNLPKTRTLKTLIDRLSKMNKVLYLIAQPYVTEDSSKRNEVRAEGINYGQLKLVVDNHNVKVQSFLNNLPLSTKIQRENIPISSNSSSRDEQQHQQIYLSTFSKKFSLILEYQNISHHEATLFMTPNEALILHLDLAPIGLGSISYYLPVLVNEESLLTSTSSSTSTKRVGKEVVRANRKSQAKAIVISGVQDSSNRPTQAYDTVNIEDIKRIVERESRLRREENVKDEGNENSDQMEDEDSDDGLWKDNSLLKAQYSKPYPSHHQMKVTNEDNEEEGEEDDEAEDSYPRRHQSYATKSSTTSRKIPNTFLFSD